MFFFYHHPVNDGQLCIYSRAARCSIVDMDRLDMMMVLLNMVAMGLIGDGRHTKS